MTQRFRSALLVLGVLAAATLAIWLVLGRGDDDPGEIGAGGGGVARGGSDDDDVAPIRLEGTGDGTRPVPGTGPRPGGLGDGLPRRTPEGVDFSDPAQVEKRLAELISDRPIDWAAVSRLAAVFDGPLSEDVRRSLLAALATGDRTGALRVFAVSRDGTLVRDLLRLLDDGGLTPGAKGALYQALAILPGANNAEVVRGLEARLTGQGRADLQALKAIGDRGGREGARAIVEYLLRVDQPDTLPHYGYLGLDLAHDPAAVGVLKEALAQTERPEVLKSLIKLSAQAGADGMVESLLALDHGEQPHEIRRGILEALARIGTDDSLAHLVQVANQPGSYGELAVQNIGRMRSATPEARARLVESVGPDGALQRDPAARRAALQALGNLREEAAIPALVEALDSGDDALVHVAAFGLGSIGEPAREHVPRLIDLFSTGDVNLQKQVVVALGGLGGQDARSALEQVLTNDRLDAGVRRSARMAIQRLKMDEAEEARVQPPAPAGSTLGGNK
jgi:HEAT repeat protein